MSRLDPSAHEEMAGLRVVPHPDKTTIGRIERGFDFLGYRFTAAGLAVAKQTVERCAARISRLYEQGATDSRVREYVRRWSRWVKAGLDGAEVEMNKCMSPLFDSAPF